MSAKAYRKDGDWSGFAVRPSKKGWIVSYYSMIQGGTNKRVTLHAYTDQFPRDIDLDADWNDWMTNGDAIEELTPTIKVIRTGYIVQ